MMKKPGLRETRFFARKTLYDLWKITGVTAPKLSLAERGYTRLNLIEKEALAGALGKSVDEIDWDHTEPMA